MSATGTSASRAATTSSSPPTWQRSPARHLLRADLREWGLHALLDDAELVTTEIVANAVNATQATHWLASRPPVRMWIRGGRACGSGTLVILVWDACATVPVPGSP